MTKEKNQYLCNIIALLSSTECESTMASMAKTLSLPISLIRKTIYVMTKNRFLKNWLLAEDDSISLAEGEGILSGDLDNAVLLLDMSQFVSSDDLLLPLSSLEFGALSAMHSELLSISRGAVFEIKESVLSFEETTKSNIQQVQAAIDNKQQLAFSYRFLNQETGKKETIRVSCYPIKIITNTTDNWVYIKTTDGFTYRMDRIISPIHSQNVGRDYPEYTEDPKEKYLWGASPISDEDVLHVKIKIRYITRNLMQKIEADTSSRQATRRIYKEGDNYFYEDDIIGANDFMRWVRGFGSSMIIVEPAILAERAKATAQKSLELYEISERWVGMI